MTEIKLYRRAINNLDDFFEYRYKSYSKEEIKDIVMKEIDAITKGLFSTYEEKT